VSMRAICLSLAIALISHAAPPNLSGTWKLRTPRPNYSEIWTVKQTTSAIHIRMIIKDDQLGDRTLDYQALFDGEAHKQTVIGTPASVTAAKLGDALSLEIKRQARPDLLLHNKRLLRLSPDAKRIESQTTQYSPPPAGDRSEVFDRQ